MPASQPSVPSRSRDLSLISSLMPPISRIGVLTGGGDAPGLNAVIRAVVKSACNAGIECLGLEDSFDGLLEFGRSRPLTPHDVRGIMRLGGTILGTVNTGNPFNATISTSEGPRQYGDRCVEMFHRMGLGALAQWLIESVQAVAKDADFFKFAAGIHESNKSWQKAIACWEQVKKLNPNDQDVNRKINALMGQLFGESMKKLLR